MKLSSLWLVFVLLLSSLSAWAGPRPRIEVREVQGLPHEGVYVQAAGAAEGQIKVCLFRHVRPDYKVEYLVKVGEGVATANPSLNNLIQGSYLGKGLVLWQGRLYVPTTSGLLVGTLNGATLQFQRDSSFGSVPVLGICQDARFITLLTANHELAHRPLNQPEAPWVTIAQVEFADFEPELSCDPATSDLYLSGDNLERYRLLTDGSTPSKEEVLGFSTGSVVIKLAWGLDYNGNPSGEYPVSLSLVPGWRVAFSGNRSLCAIFPAGYVGFYSFLSGQVSPWSQRWLQVVDEQDLPIYATQLTSCSAWTLAWDAFAYRAYVVDSYDGVATPVPGNRQYGWVVPFGQSVLCTDHEYYKVWEIVTVSRTGATGDINDDGQVSVSDAVLALKLVTGLIKATPTQLYEADLDQDGVVTIMDALAILRIALNSAVLPAPAPPAEFG